MKGAFDLAGVFLPIAMLSTTIKARGNEDFSMQGERGKSCLRERHEPALRLSGRRWGGVGWGGGLNGDTEINCEWDTGNQRWINGGRGGGCRDRV